MSEDIKAEPAADTQAPLVNGADTSAPEKAAPAEKADDDFLDTPESEAKADDAKAEDGKPAADAKAEDDDFLAETDKDKAKDKADGAADAKPDGESEAYQPFALPDGLEIDEGLVAKATPVLKKLGLDQAGAQELVSFYATEIAAKASEAVQTHHQSLADAHATTLKTWETELAALPEYKGDALKTAKQSVNLALTKLGSPELKKLLVNDYGVVRNPHVFKFLDAVGKKLSPDSLVPDDAGADVKSAQRRPADEMYS